MRKRRQPHDDREPTDTGLARPGSAESLMPQGIETRRQPGGTAGGYPAERHRRACAIPPVPRCGSNAFGLRNGRPGER